MNIYVDFDDCLCETARHFSKLVKEMFDMDFPYEEIIFFNLQKTFNLSDDDFEKMMIEAHKPEVLLSYEETLGASRVINNWIDKGYDVSIITGRPFSVYEPSRKWLDNHNLKRTKLFCLDKYGRDNFIKNSDFSLELEDFYKMKFDVAVEDSPTAFKYFNHLPDVRVMVFDRPWNKGCDFPEGDFKRVYDWETIERLVK